MRKVPIIVIVLSVALAAAIFSGLILYVKYFDAKGDLLISEKNLSALNEKVIRLNKETSALRDQVHKNAEHLKELESARERVSELENAITMKDQTLSECEEMLRMLECRPGEKKYRMSGDLTAIDIDYNTVVIEVPLGGNMQTVGGPLSPKAILKRDGQSVGLADFQVGDRVIFIWQSTKKGHLILSLKAK